MDGAHAALVGHADAPRPLPGLARASGASFTRTRRSPPPGRRRAEEIPCYGTTHADHFDGAVPVTRQLTAAEIEGEYERATGEVILETFVRLGLGPLDRPAVLVASHGPFAWGASVERGGRERDRARGGGGRGAAHQTGASRTSLRSATTCAGGTSAASTGRRPTTGRRVEGAPAARAERAAAARRARPVACAGGGARARLRRGSLRFGSALAARGRDRRRPARASTRARARVRGRRRLGPARGRTRCGRSRRSMRRCDLCTAGLEHLCPAVRFAGHGSTDGALRTLLPWPERLLHPVPETLTDVEAALAEPLGVALHAFDLGHVRPGAGAGVFGCGPLGLLLVQLLRTAGASPIVATDRSPTASRQPRSSARRTRLSPMSSPRLAPRGRFRGGGRRRRCRRGVAALRPGGRLVLVGIPEGDRTSLSRLGCEAQGPDAAPVATDAGGRPPARAPARGGGRVDLAPLVEPAVTRSRSGRTPSRRCASAGPEGRRDPSRERPTHSGSTSGPSPAAPSSSTAPTAARSRPPSASTPRRHRRASAGAAMVMSSSSRSGPCRTPPTTCAF